MTDKLALITDPVERVIAEALDSAGIAWHGERHPSGVGLDFYLPDCGVHIECKRMHSERISEQMARASDVIAIQGMKSAKWLASLIQKRMGCEPWISGS